MTEQPAFKRDDRVEITGPDDKGNTEYLGLHGRVINRTEGTGAFWLHSLEERWYIPGFYPASSLRLLPEVKGRPARPAFPTCSTCKHFQPKAVYNRIDTCANLELNQDHHKDGRYGFRPPSASYGCLLHSDLTEAGA